MNRVKQTVAPIALRLDGRSADQIKFIQAAMSDRYQEQPSTSVVIRRAIGLLSKRIDGLIQSDSCDELENELYFLRAAADGQPSAWPKSQDFKGMTGKSYTQLVSEKLRADFNVFLDEDGRQ